MKAVSYKWLPVVEADRCTGCGECVLACGPQCLDIVNGIAVLTNPDICGSEEHCIAPCPEKAIRMEWVPCKGDHTRGQWSNTPDGYEI